MGPSMRFSFVLLVVGVAMLAFGLYWTAAAANADLVYERNCATCTAFPCCDAPPPPIWGVVAVPGLFVLAGTIPLAWGIVRTRRELRRRAALRFRASS
jgi:hypothetical protein